MLLPPQLSLGSLEQRLMELPGKKIVKIREAQTYTNRSLLKQRHQWKQQPRKKNRKRGPCSVSRKRASVAALTTVIAQM